MLERYADGRRIQAASLVSFGTVLPLAMPLSFGAVALTTLRRGPVEGAVVAGLGIGFVAVLLLVSGGATQGLMTVAAATAVVLGLADVLRRTGSLSLALQAGIGVGAAMLLAMLVAIGDQEVFWRGLAERMFDQMAQQGAGLTAEQRDTWMTALPFAAMTGLLVGSMTLFVWVGLFLGRSWQARIVNPGGFSQEFRELKFGKLLALASAGVFFGNALIGQAWLLNVSAFLIHVWIVQGLAFLHWTVARARPERRSLWLVVSYVLLGIFWATGNPLAIIVPLAGMVGEIVDYRGLVLRRMGRGGED